MPDYPMPDELFRPARAGETVPCTLVVENCSAGATHVVTERPEDGVCDGHYIVLEARARFYSMFGGPLGPGDIDLGIRIKEIHRENERFRAFIGGYGAALADLKGEDVPLTQEDMTKVEFRDHIRSRWREFNDE